MTVLSYPEAKTYEPVGRCIYCGADACGGKLQREHIIPYGLNGTLILPQASCAACAKITGAVETFCLQTMLIDARTHLGLASHSHRRNKKPRPLPRIVIGDASNRSEVWHDIAINKHPFALMTMEYSPAGLLSGRPKNVNPKLQGRLIPSPGFDKRFAALPQDAELRYRVDTDQYARMLAKIAHSFVVANYGFGAFKPFLPKAILGRSKDIFHFVGGCEPRRVEDPTILHSISAGEQGDLILVYLRLFAFMEAPAYRIVVGRRPSSATTASTHAR